MSGPNATTSSTYTSLVNGGSQALPALAKTCHQLSPSCPRPMSIPSPLSNLGRPYDRTTQIKIQRRKLSMPLSEINFSLYIYVYIYTEMVECELFLM